MCFQEDSDKDAMKKLKKKKKKKDKEHGRDRDEERRRKKERGESKERKRKTDDAEKVEIGSDKHNYALHTNMGLYGDVTKFCLCFEVFEGGRQQAWSEVATVVVRTEVLGHSQRLTSRFSEERHS